MTMPNTYTDSLFTVSLLNSLSRRLFVTPRGFWQIQHRGYVPDRGLRTMLTALVSFAPTVIFCFDVPCFSCQAASVYVPGCRLLQSKPPSLPVTVYFDSL